MTSAASPAGRPGSEPTPSATPRALQPAPPRGMLRWLLRLPVYLYRAGLGSLLGPRFLYLVHTGRRTGLRRETVLEVVWHDPAAGVSVVAAGWGRRTAWLHNVEAGLAREVVTGGDRYVPEHRVLSPDLAERIFADYERGNGIPAPVVRAVISRLVGWPYDGTPAARRRVVEQLPLVTFRPAGAGTDDEPALPPSRGAADRSPGPTGRGTRVVPGVPSGDRSTRRPGP
jgi:deazaflavin-dependent oxidoreductase (nitroreductase family)